MIYGRKKKKETPRFFSVPTNISEKEIATQAIINCGLTPRFSGSKMVAPPDGVHCDSSDSTRKARYLFTHFDRFQAWIFFFDHVTSVYV